MSNSSNLDLVYSTQISVTPQYQVALERRLADISPEMRDVLENIAGQIVTIASDELEEFCLGYKWICDALLEEELNFRRTGKYRLDTFQQAVEQVYDRPEIMGPYMKGLLMTQLWWPNHTKAISFLKNDFIKNLEDNYSLLEIGPGHGLLSYYPAIDPLCRHIEAWDISQASLDATRQCLEKMGVKRQITLKHKNLFDANPSEGRFSAIIFSEVLEHLEKPKESLQILSSLLEGDGRIYIHMPINSPAPDHLFNCDTPEELRLFVNEADLEVVHSEFFPMLGADLDRARKQRLTISCVLVARSTL